MQKPTIQEIDKAIVNLAKENESVSKCYVNSFVIGFKMAIEWLLNWQKTQPLTVYYVMVGELEIADVCRTNESAEKSISDFKKDFPKVEFWIDERIIK